MREYILTMQDFDFVKEFIRKSFKYRLLLLCTIGRRNKERDDSFVKYEEVAYSINMVEETLW